MKMTDSLVGRDPYKALPIVDGPVQGQTHAWPHRSFQVDSSPGSLGSLPSIVTYHLNQHQQLGWVWSLAQPS